MIKFIIPSVSASGLIVPRDHLVSASTPSESVLESIRTIGGQNIVKDHQLPPLCMHFSKDLKSRVHEFESEESWARVKEEWVKECAKKKDDAAAEIILPKGVSLIVTPVFF